MDFLLHILGLCPDHGSHFDIFNYFTMVNTSDVVSYIQKVSLSLSIRIKNLFIWKT